VLRLAGINLISAVVFFSIYLAAGGRRLSQEAFLASLMVFFGALTALWLHVERPRGRHHDPLSRLGCIAGALVLTLVTVPAVVLMPLFALKGILPADDRLDDVIRSAMVLLLVSLALVATLNVTGVCVITGSALVRRLRGTRPRVR